MNGFDFGDLSERTSRVRLGGPDCCFSSSHQQTFFNSYTFSRDQEKSEEKMAENKQKGSNGRFIIFVVSMVYYDNDLITIFESRRRVIS